MDHAHDGRFAPGLDPGVTLLRRPAGDGRALHRLVAGALDGGHALWVDAGDRASTYEFEADRRSLSGLRVARAFTAYQHHTLVERAATRLTDDAELLVAPCTAALYRDDDLREPVAEELLGDALETLSAAAARHEVPVLVTAASDAAVPALSAAADRELVARRTREGLLFEGETTVYWGRDGFQTTLDYWTDLFGCVCGSTAAADPPVAEV